MGATESWISITEEGAFLVTENDGWVYLRRGPERSRVPVVIVEIADPQPGEHWGRISYAKTTAGPVAGWLSINADQAAAYRRRMPGGTLTVREMVFEHVVAPKLSLIELIDFVRRHHPDVTAGEITSMAEEMVREEEACARRRRQWGLSF
jgi:hypothetical protein